MNKLDEERGFLRSNVIDSFEKQIKEELEALIDDVVVEKVPPNIIYLRDLGNNACIFNHHEFVYHSEHIQFNWFDPFFPEQKIVLGYSYTYQAFDFDYSEQCVQYVFAGKDTYYPRHPFKATALPQSLSPKDVCRELAINYWEEYKFFFESYLYAKFLIANNLVENRCSDNIVKQFDISPGMDLNNPFTTKSLNKLKEKAYKGYEDLKAKGQQIKFDNNSPIYTYSEFPKEIYTFKPEDIFPVRV